MFFHLRKSKTCQKNLISINLIFNGTSRLLIKDFLHMKISKKCRIDFLFKYLFLRKSKFNTNQFSKINIKIEFISQLFKKFF